MPRPKKINHFLEFIIKWYSPVSIPLGLHFKEYDNFIKTPIIREELRNCDVGNKGHYTVYLPSFEEKNLLKHLKNTKVKWDLFSKHYKGQPYQDSNITIYPISYEWFINSFANCEGILCNAGFETPSEALYLGKKLFVIPMKGQYEQECNAEALKSMGINVIYKIDENFTENLNNWIELPFKIQINYENNINSIVETILEYRDKYKDIKEFDYSKFYELNGIETEENKFNFFN
ncbi:MAG: hypothetical protein GTO02_10730 [Candidatus Dadabacteria bacterium]|nr:hypothetical protein [Candidatus Dadabacteria bacterium]